MKAGANVQPFARLSHLLETLAYGLGQWIVDNPLLAGAALVAAFFACILYVFRAALHDSDVPRRQW